MDENIQRVVRSYDKAQLKIAKAQIRNLESGLHDSDKWVRRVDEMNEALCSERDALEERIEQLERIGKRLLEEYEKEEEECGFPFNFALRNAHSDLGKALEEDIDG